MIRTIEDYLTLLKKELKGYDQATIQDALADAEDHLRSALDSKLENAPQNAPEALLLEVVEEYGTPEEVSAAYQEIETYTQPAFSRKEKSQRNLLERFFGVYGEPQAWAALLYCFFSFITGVIYFVWAVTGISVSLGLSITILGWPIMAFFLFSFRGIALVEGRIVEALLGERMPRRAVFVDKNLGWFEKLKRLITDSFTWKIVLYMILQFVLGTIYFCVFITLIALGVGLIASPFTQLVFSIPIIQLGSTVYMLPAWSLIFAALLGVIILTATLHLAKLVGRVHSSIAKGLLVNK